MGSVSPLENENNRYPSNEFNNNNNNNIGGTINSTNDQNNLPVNHMIDPKNNIENGNVEDEEMKIQKMREAEKKRREEQLKKETGIMGLTEQNEMMNQFERGFY